MNTTFSLRQTARHIPSGFTVTIVGLWIDGQATIIFKGQSAVDGYIVDCADLEAV